MLIYQIVDAFDNAKLNYAIVGGYALALHGLVRATIDVDIVLSLDIKNFELAEKVLNKIGLTSRLPIRGQDIIKMREEYIKNRNLIAWSFVDSNNPSRQVDILITEDLKNLAIQKIQVSGRKIKVVGLQDLMRMKQNSGRPQDLVDVENIKRILHEKKHS